MLHFTSLIQCLNSFDHSIESIAYKDGRFFRTINKDENALDKVEIITFGKLALEKLHNEKISFSNKARLYKILAHGFTRYLSAIKSPEPDDDEIKLREIITTSIKLSEILIKKDAEIMKYIDIEHDIVSDINVFESDSKLPCIIPHKIFFYSLFDSSKSPIPEPEPHGLNSQHATMWLLQHLRNYKALCPLAPPLDPNRLVIDSIIKQLEEIFLVAEIITFLEVEEWTENVKSDLQEIALKEITSIKSMNAFTVPDSFLTCENDLRDWYTARIREKILALKSEEEYAFAAGCDARDANHAVVYVFHPKAGGMYSLTCIDTSPEFYSPKNSTGDRQNVQDIVWLGIPSQAVRPEFITLLVEPQAVGCENIDDILKKIRAYLRRFPTVREVVGQIHTGQVKGSCALKCLTSWVHRRMGEPLWRHFKAYYSAEEVKKLPKILANVTDPEMKQLFTRESNNILAKRNKKLLRIFAASRLQG